MDKNDYTHMVKMYNGLKAINRHADKLSPVCNLSVQFASITAVRDVLKEWDAKDENDENFLVVLSERLAQAQYTVCEIIMNHQENK